MIVFSYSSTLSNLNLLKHNPNWMMKKHIQTDEARFDDDCKKIALNSEQKMQLSSPKLFKTFLPQVFFVVVLSCEIFHNQFQHMVF